MTALGSLLALYIAVALVGSIMGAIMFVDGDVLEFDGLGNEGRVIIGILAGILWPLLALWGVAWVLRAAWRGLVQCVRFVVPRKAKLPRAQVRR